jgi:hypothetical protein
MCVELVPEVFLGTNPKGFVCSSTATNDALYRPRWEGVCSRDGGGGDACDAGPSSRKRFKFKEMSMSLPCLADRMMLVEPFQVASHGERVI